MFYPSCEVIDQDYCNSNDMKFCPGDDVNEPSCVAVCSVRTAYEWAHEKCNGRPANVDGACKSPRDLPSGY